MVAKGYRSRKPYGKERTVTPAEPHSKDTKLDLERTDVYEDLNVPDRDLVITLRVIRTLRAASLEEGFFDAEAAVLFSHVHAKIVGMIKRQQQLWERNGKG